jgi:hypothetical protein
MANATLSPNPRELEDGEIVNITESPEGHGIAQDAESVLPQDHLSLSMVDKEEPLLKQAGTPACWSSLPVNKGKGCI